MTIRLYASSMKKNIKRLAPLAALVFASCVETADVDGGLEKSVETVLVESERVSAKALEVSAVTAESVARAHVEGQMKLHPLKAEITNVESIDSDDDRYDAAISFIKEHPGDFHLNAKLDGSKVSRITFLTIRADVEKGGIIKEIEDTMVYAIDAEGNIIGFAG